MSSLGPDRGTGGEPPAERRREPRRRVLLKGRIVYPGSGFSLECTIRDLTANGARIAVAPEAILRDPFLVVLRQAVAHQSRAAWRTEGETGLEFLKSVDIQKDAAAQPQAARRIQADLDLL